MSFRTKKYIESDKRILKHIDKIKTLLLEIKADLAKPSSYSKKTNRKETFQFPAKYDTLQ